MNAGSDDFLSVSSNSLENKEKTISLLKTSFEVVFFLLDVLNCMIPRMMFAFRLPLFFGVGCCKRYDDGPRFLPTI